MKYTASILAFLIMSAATPAQHHSAEPQSAVLMSGLGSCHHPVSTTSADAQRFFDQGLTLIYAFNHEEAARSFKRAAELDPQLAMAHWGVALAIGPNYNLDVDPEREKAAYDSIQKALTLGAKAPDNERAYMEALAQRYTSDPKADLKKLAVNYKNAMGALVKRYPDDLDAATLYAESAMDLRPWQLWGADGKPAEGTDEIIAVLDSVLKRDPQHIGANHFYIHALEASPHPERALPSADRLKTLAPAAGHLVHMPSHIYMRTGDYAAAAESNVKGAEADRAYIKVAGAGGLYPMMYYSHNLHFLASALAVEGRFADAKNAADQLEGNVSPHVKDMAMLDWFMPTSTLILVHFRRWNDILKLQEPDRERTISNGMWRFARAMAYAATGKLDSAEADQKAFVAAEQAIPADLPWGFNNAATLFKIADNMLAARIALAKGGKKSAIESLRAAVLLEDGLAYDEPPDWVLPARESLGGALLSNRDYTEAEAVFRADLERHPRSGRSLFGLCESLKGQGKSSAAAFVQSEFAAAWKNSDTALRIEDL